MNNPEMYYKSINEIEPIIINATNYVLNEKHIGEAFKREYANDKNINLYDVALHCDFIMSIFVDTPKFGINSGIYRVDVKTITEKNDKGPEKSNFSIPDSCCMSNHPDIFAFKYDNVIYFCKYVDAITHMFKNKPEYVFRLLSIKKVKEISIFSITLTD